MGKSQLNNLRPNTPQPHHFFIPILPPSTHQQFSIPKSFLKFILVGDKRKKKTCNNKKREVVEAILRSNGRGKSFHVKMIIINGKKIMISEQENQGWKDFYTHHELHVGDFLLFRHLGSLSFDVIVFDSTSCQREYPPLDLPSFDQTTTPKKNSKVTPPPPKAKRVDAAAGSCNTPSHQFVTTLKRYNFSEFTLNIPTEFARSNGLEKKICMVTFRDEKGKSWPMNLRYKMSSGQVYIRAGWRTFINENELKEGDICTFDLVSRGTRGTKNIVFDVRVSRSSPLSY